jgi:hypothetical protein
MPPQALGRLRSAHIHGGNAMMFRVSTFITVE